MRISSGQGDHGMTRLGDGRQVVKGDLQIEMLGCLDQLNSQIGICRSYIDNQESHSWQNKILKQLIEIQEDLFLIGALLAGSKRTAFDEQRLSPKKIETYTIDLEDRLPELKNFVLPGGSLAAAQMHNVRAVCRGFERVMNRFFQKQTEPFTGQQSLLVYVNRLSDFFFCVARMINHQENIAETLWSGKKD